MITSSGDKTANGAISAGPCTLVGVAGLGGGDAWTATLYDNPSAASGTVLARIGAAASTRDRLFFGVGVAAKTGVYLSITGTTPTINVYTE